MNSSNLLLKTKEIRAALDSGLYNCALALSLTLPDVCAIVKYPDAKKHRAQSYKKWFCEYVQPLFTSIAESLPDYVYKEYTWFTDEECWALRCAVLHAGNYSLEKVDLTKVRLHAHMRDGISYSHFFQSGQSVDWDVVQICETICQAAEHYYDSIEDKSRFVLDEVVIESW